MSTVLPVHRQDISFHVQASEQSAFVTWRLGHEKLQLYMSLTLRTSHRLPLLQHVTAFSDEDLQLTCSINSQWEARLKAFCLKKSAQHNTNLSRGVLVTGAAKLELWSISGQWGTAITAVLKCHPLSHALEPLCTEPKARLQVSLPCWGAFLVTVGEELTLPVSSRKCTQLAY